MWNKYLLHEVFPMCPNWATLVKKNRQATFVSSFSFAVEEKKEIIGNC